jgi:hypothetical protein
MQGTSPDRRSPARRPLPECYAVRARFVNGRLPAAAFPPHRSAAGLPCRPFVAAALFIYGVGALTFTIGNVTLRQPTTPAHLLGRVTSSMRLLVWIGQPAAGPRVKTMAADSLTTSSPW